jgi:hypothetical protein
LAALAEIKRLPIAFLNDLGLHDLPVGCVGIPYYGPTGEEIAVKKRTAMKAKDGSFWPKGKPLAAYGQWRIADANKAGLVILVEGESDAWVLWHHGLPALGIPGANAARTLESEHVESVETLYVVREPDGGGEQFVNGILNRLAVLPFIRGGRSVLGFAGKVFELRMPDGVKDPADVHAQDPDRFLARMKEAIVAAKPLELPRMGEQNGSDAKPAGQTPPARTIPAYRPFPVHALPSPLSQYVTEAAKAVGIDPAYVALPCLAVAAGLIGYTRVLHLKRSWRVPCVLWTLVVAPSGWLKTPGWKHATEHLFTLQKRLNGQTIFTSDATIEALAELIDENPRGLLVCCDELNGWFNSFARYKGKAGGTDLPRWLSMHSAGGFAYHRKTGDRRRIVVPHAAVSIAGGIQPGILARTLTGEFMDAGLASRLLVAMPPRPVKVWTELEIHPDTERRYYALLDALNALPFDSRDGENVPHVLRLLPGAKAAWVRWYDDWARAQAAVDGELAAAFSKLEEAPARFALVHHVVSRAGRGESDLCPVEAESVAAGVDMARWFAFEAERVYAVLAESPEQHKVRGLGDFIRSRGGRISVRELQRSNGRKYPDSASAEASLDGLVQAGLGTWLPSEAGNRARIMELCPTPDTSDSSDADVSDDSRLPSDSSPDRECRTPEKHGESGVLSDMSDMSDRRTGIATPSANGEAKSASVGQSPRVSDTGEEVESRTHRSTDGKCGPVNTWPPGFEEGEL